MTFPTVFDNLNVKLSDMEEYENMQTLFVYFYMFEHVYKNRNLFVCLSVCLSQILPQISSQVLAKPLHSCIAFYISPAISYKKACVRKVYQTRILGWHATPYPSCSICSHQCGGSC